MPGSGLSGTDGAHAIRRRHLGAIILCILYFLL